MTFEVTHGRCLKRNLSLKSIHLRTHSRGVPKKELRGLTIGQF
jgi:hypothetical protein